MNVIKNDLEKTGVMKKDKEVLFAIVFVLGLIAGILITFYITKVDNLYDCIKICL